MDSQAQVDFVKKNSRVYFAHDFDAFFQNGENVEQILCFNRKIWFVDEINSIWFSFS